MTDTTPATPATPEPPATPTIDCRRRARHKSKCPACGTNIRAGQQIARVAGEWVHHACARVKANA